MIETDGEKHQRDPQSPQSSQSPQIKSPAITVRRKIKSYLEKSIGRFYHQYNEADRRTVGSLSFALLFVIFVRALPFPDIFRGTDIVLSSNDPYYYRYWVEQISRQATSPIDWTVLANLPEGVRNGEPLMIMSLSWLVELGGGSPLASGIVLALYPVLSAVLTGAMVYVIATRITNDKRVGIAAVFFFAAIPGHAFRTGLGFADHHAFDYFWLTLTVLLTIQISSVELEQRKQWMASIGLGIAVAAQTLAWEASPLLLVPFAGVLVALSLFDVDKPQPTQRALLYVTAGLALSALLSGVFHVVFGWHQAIVVATPVILFNGAMILLVVTSVTQQIGRSWPTLVLLEGLSLFLIGLGIIGTGIAPSELSRGIQTLFGPAQAAEMSSIIDTFGVIYGPLIMLGFASIIGIPALLFAFLRTRDSLHPGIPIVGIYILYFLGLSFIQRRFTGELAPFIAVFAGLGFICFASWLDLVRMPTRYMKNRGEHETGETTLEYPDRRRAIVLAGLGLSTLGFPTLYAAFIHNRVTIDDASFNAAKFMREYSQSHDLDYPNNFVLSPWGRNRMYNYFVNGEARSYSYARTHYADFIFSDDPEGWYDRFKDRVGFIVTYERSGGFLDSMQYRLHHAMGSRAARNDGLSHYRCIYSGHDGERKVFTVEEGATLKGTIQSESITDIYAIVSIPGDEFRYSRRLGTTNDGRFEITVPYPGQYNIGNTKVSISEQDVLSGKTIDLGSISEA